MSLVHGAPESALDVCLCTHSPDPAIFRRVLDALATQRESRGRYTVLIIDNASEPPLDESILDDLVANHIECRLIHEPNLGLVNARTRGIRESRAPLILFVDDDNELSPTYVAAALEIARNDVGIGCFGGKIRLPDGITPPWYLGDYVRFLAIRDDGEESITRLTHEWGPWEPIGAGAIVRRELAELFVQRVDSDSRVRALGRRGRAGLYCGEDNLMMRSAAQLGMKSSYQPRLSLIHHMPKSRFRVGYMLRLLYWFGRSDVLLNRILWGEFLKPDPRPLWRTIPGRIGRMLRFPFRSLFDLAVGLGRWVELKNG